MEKISKWFPPFCGVVSVVLGVIVGILIGQGQDATKKTPLELVDYYKDHETKHTVAAILIIFVAIFVLYFGGWVRRVLRDAEGADGILSAVAFAGTIVFSAGASVAASIHLALPDLADDIDPVALQAINGIDYDMFAFFPVGLSTLVLATGISAVRHGALPRWFAWTGVVLGVLGYSPVFFVIWFLVPVAPLWVLILSVMGMRGTVGGEPAPATA